jgi:hypothetical protein
MTSSQDFLSFYSDSYTSSRARFLTEAKRIGAQLYALPVPSKTPVDGTALAIDIAVIGDINADKHLVYTAGTHGIEGFVGSAIQLGILNRIQRAPHGHTLIMVHCLNPWGMYNFRRTNEQNVDLNRNWRLPDAAISPAPPHYEELRSLLIPEAPGSFAAFTLKALSKVAKLGFPAVKQAVTGGQYLDANGLFFGGYKVQPELELFGNWAKENLSKSKWIIAIDIHSGLGRFGDYTLLVDHQIGSSEHSRIIDIFGSEKVHGPDPRLGISYKTSGSAGNLLPHLLPQTRVDQVVHEFGTLHPFKVLHALVQENFYYHSNLVTKTGGIGRPGARILKDTFCPNSDLWRRNAVSNGFLIFDTASSFTK